MKLTDIRIDGGTQCRAELNEEAVADYAAAIQSGTELPPIVVFFDGSNYWLADGFHRYHAHDRAGEITDIEAEVRNGTRRDAVLYSVGANAQHGLRRSNADKRKAVETLLNDKEWAEWSDREIAKRCGVTHPFVASIRAPKPKAQPVSQREKEVVTVTTSAPEAAPVRDSVKTEAPAKQEPAAKAETIDSTQLRDEYNALVDSAQEMAAQLETVQDVLSGDPAKQLLALRAQLRSTKSARDAAIRERGEMLKDLNAAKTKIARLERELAKAKAVAGAEY